MIEHPAESPDGDHSPEPALEEAGPAEPTANTSPLAAFWDVTVGSLLLISGLAGLVLPVLPGWLWIIPGLMLITGRIPPVRRRINDALMSPPGLRLLRRGLAVTPIRAAFRRLLRNGPARRALRFDTRSVVLRGLLHIDGTPGAASPPSERSNDS